jgi:hypothetical protein
MNSDLTPLEAMEILTKVRNRILESMKKVDRKRSWLDSEKAMMKAHYARQAQALLYAIRLVNQEQTKQMPMQVSAE